MQEGGSRAIETTPARQYSEQFSTAVETLNNEILLASLRRIVSEARTQQATCRDSAVTPKKLQYSTEPRTPYVSSPLGVAKRPSR